MNVLYRTDVSKTNFTRWFKPINHFERVLFLFVAIRANHVGREGHQSQQVFNEKWQRKKKKSKNVSDRFVPQNFWRDFNTYYTTIVHKKLTIFQNFTAIVLVFVSSEKISEQVSTLNFHPNGSTRFVCTIKTEIYFITVNCTINSSKQTAENVLNII